MKKLVCIMAVMLLPVFIAGLASEFGPAPGSDETLRFYLGKSELVALGKIVTEPQQLVYEDVVFGYLCDFEVE